MKRRGLSMKASKRLRSKGKRSNSKNVRLIPERGGFRL